MRRILRNSRGMSLLIVMVIMTIILSMTAAALLISGIDTRTTNNLQTGTAALEVADAGVQHAVALLPYGTDFNALLTGYVSGFPCVPAPPCNGTTSKPTLTHALGVYAYTVVVDNDTNVSEETATTDHDQIVNLTATATGPNNSVRKIAVTVARSNIFVPPAQDATKELKGKKAANVTGSTGSPSVVTVADKIDVKQLIHDILALGLPGQNLQTVKDGKYKDATWGTYDNPMITQITGDADLKGDISGYGVLIVQGSLKIHDMFDWNGLIIVDDNFEIAPDKKQMQP